MLLKEMYMKNNKFVIFNVEFVFDIVLELLFLSCII